VHEILHGVQFAREAGARFPIEQPFLAEHLHGQIVRTTVTSCPIDNAHAAADRRQQFEGAELQRGGSVHRRASMIERTGRRPSPSLR
jgi:hypothetical protein